MIPPLDTPGQGTRRGAAIVERACVRDFQATLGHRPWPLCGSTHGAVALLPLAAELSTHTHTFSWSVQAPGDKFTRKFSLRSHLQGDLRFPVAEFCCLSLSEPRLLQVTDSCPSQCDLCQEPVSTRRMQEWRRLISSSCWCPVAARPAQVWEYYRQQHHCVFFYSKKNILALFILKAIVYLLWKNINIYVYNQINRWPEASFFQWGEELSYKYHFTRNSFTPSADLLPWRAAATHTCIYYLELFQKFSWLMHTVDFTVTTLRLAVRLLCMATKEGETTLKPNQGENGFDWNWPLLSITEYQCG